jgi:hypothetical protein
MIFVLNDYFWLFLLIMLIAVFIILSRFARDMYWNEMKCVGG